jgi:hypothetical protein
MMTTTVEQDPLTIESDVDDCVNFIASTLDEIQQQFVYLSRLMVIAKRKLSEDVRDREASLDYFRIKGKLKDIRKTCRKKSGWFLPTKLLAIDWEEEVVLSRLDSITNQEIFQMERTASLKRWREVQLNRRLREANYSLRRFMPKCIIWRRADRRLLGWQRMIHISGEIGKTVWTMKSRSLRAIMRRGCGENSWDNIIKILEEYPHETV